MPSRNNCLSLLFVATSTLLGFAACGSDDSSSSDVNGGAGGTSSAGVGGANAINGTARGGAWTTTSSTRPSTGGAAVGIGGRSGVGNGGNENAGGQTTVDWECNQGLACSDDCTSACPGQTDTSYTCTCTDGELDCDMTSCEFEVPTCADDVTDGSDCTSTDTMCTSADGNTFCFCDTDSNQWGCSDLIP